MRVSKRRLLIILGTWLIVTSCGLDGVKRSSKGSSDSSNDLKTGEVEPSSSQTVPIASPKEADPKAPPIVPGKIKGGKHATEFKELSTRLRTVATSLHPARSLVAEVGGAKFASFGLTIEDPIEAVVDRAIERLDAEALQLDTHAEELAELESRFLVTNSDGQTELQGMRELKQSLDAQIDELTQAETSSIVEESQQRRKIDNTKEEIATKGAEAALQAGTMDARRTVMQEPFDALVTLMNENKTALQTEPTDYTSSEGLLQIVENIETRIAQLESAADGIEIDLAPFDRLAADMQSLSTEAADVEVQIGLVRDAITARGEEASVSNQESQENASHLKETQQDLRISVDALRANVEGYDSILSSIKKNELLAINAEVNRLQGAADILLDLANEELDTELKQKYIDVRKTITDAITNLSEIKDTLATKVTDANATIAEQRDIVDDQATIQVRQAEVLRQLDEMIEEQAEKIAQHNQIIQNIDELTAEIQEMARIHTTAVDNILNLRENLSNFVGDFSRAIADAHALATKARENVAAVEWTAGWTNPRAKWDVNFDGLVTPLDILILINRLNDPDFSRFLPDVRPIDQPFLDVNGDKMVTPVDIIQIINRINAQND